MNDITEQEGSNTQNEDFHFIPLSRDQRQLSAYNRMHTRNNVTINDLETFPYNLENVHLESES